MKSIVLATLMLTSISTVAAEEATLIEIRKSAHQVHHMVMGANPIITTLTCSITDSSKAFIKHQSNFGTSPQISEVEIKAKDMSRLKLITESIAKNSDDKFYLYERDFTGYKTDETSSKYLKDDDGYAFHNGEKIHFYSLRRRLSKLYDGPHAIELRDLVSKYCNLYL